MNSIDIYNSFKKHNLDNINSYIGFYYVSVIKTISDMVENKAASFEQLCSFFNFLIIRAINTVSETSYDDYIDLINDLRLNSYGEETYEALQKDALGIEKFTQLNVDSKVVEFCNFYFNYFKQADLEEERADDLADFIMALIVKYADGDVTNYLDKNDNIINVILSIESDILEPYNTNKVLIKDQTDLNNALEIIKSMVRTFKTDVCGLKLSSYHPYELTTLRGTKEFDGEKISLMNLETLVSVIFKHNGTLASGTLTINYTDDADFSEGEVFNTIEKCVADTYKSLMHLKSGAYDKDEHRVIFFLNALQIKSFKYQYDRRNNVEAEWISLDGTDRGTIDDGFFYNDLKAEMERVFNATKLDGKLAKEDKGKYKKYVKQGFDVIFDINDDILDLAYSIYGKLISKK